MNKYQFLNIVFKRIKRLLFNTFLGKIFVSYLMFCVFIMLIAAPLWDVSFFFLAKHLSLYSIFSPDFLDWIRFSISLLIMYQGAIIAQSYAFNSSLIKICFNTQNDVIETFTWKSSLVYMLLISLTMIALLFYFMDPPILFQASDVSKPLYIRFIQSDLKNYVKDFTIFNKAIPGILRAALSGWLILYWGFFISFNLLTPYSYILVIKKFIWKSV